jgi:hypothetical protein
MATINLALNVQVVGGPTVLISKSKSVQAYDKIEVAIEPGSEKSVEIQPGAADKVSFLLIKSSVYSSEQSLLTYRVNDGTSDFPDSTQPAKPPIALDEPHLYFGLGAVSAFGLAPKILKFTNSTGTPAAIEVLVGRDAI